VPGIPQSGGTWRRVWRRWIQLSQGRVNSSGWVIRRSPHLPEATLPPVSINGRCGASIEITLGTFEKRSGRSTQGNREGILGGALSRMCRWSPSRCSGPIHPSGFVSAAPRSGSKRAARPCDGLDWEPVRRPPHTAFQHVRAASRASLSEVGRDPRPSYSLQNAVYIAVGSIK